MSERSTYKVNGWTFDFKNMIAYRDGYSRSIYYSNGRILLCVLENKFMWTFVPFFDPPEDGFNAEITRLYIDYSFENAILTAEVDLHIVCIELSFL